MFLFNRCSAGRVVVVLIAAISASFALAQTSGPATRPVSEGKSAMLTVRLLIDRVGLPDQKTSIDHVLEIAEPTDAPQPIKDVAAWVKANRESIDGATAGPLTTTPWGRTTLRKGKPGEPTKLYLHILEWHASGKVIAYGLSAGNVSRAYLLTDPTKDLKIDKTDRDVVLEVTAKNGKPPSPVNTVVVVETTGDPVLNSLAVKQAEDKSILLHSKNAIVIGRNLRYEPEPNKNTVGYWTNPEDWVYWEFDTQQAGAFDVEILQGCGKGSGGSEIMLSVDKTEISFVVQDTGGFQNFVPRVVGQVKLDAGKHRLEVKVKEKKGAAVMDLRQVVLKPKG